jgi:hypothetical protein
MAITSGVGKKFMEELPLGMHTLSEGSPTDVIKIALYGPNAIIAPTVDTYTTSGECSGGGYTAGGDIVADDLVIVGASGSARTSGTQFSEPYINPLNDITIAISGVAVRGCMLYNSSQGDRNIFTLDFGQTLTPAYGILLPWALADVDTIEKALIPLIGNTI